MKSTLSFQLGALRNVLASVFKGPLVQVTVATPGFQATIPLAKRFHSHLKCKTFVKKNCTGVDRNKKINRQFNCKPFSYSCDRSIFI